MSFFDTILLVIIAVFVLNGLIRGLIRSIGSLAALLIGLWCAIYFHQFVYDLLKNLFFGHELLGKIVSFIIIYALVNSLVNFAFMVLNNAYDIISIIPFLKTINRLGGGIFGLIEGGLILGVIIYFGLRFPPLESILKNWIAKSEVAPFLIGFADKVMPLIPAIFDWVRGFFTDNENAGNIDVI